jgi:DNA-binding Lrp family transcriptional regulator
MSQKERDWLHGLKQAEGQQITQAKAAERMGVSERWVRQLLRRKKKEGDRVGKRFQPAPGQSRWMDRFRVSGNAAVTSSSSSGNAMHWRGRVRSSC